MVTRNSLCILLAAILLIVSYGKLTICNQKNLTIKTLPMVAKVGQGGGATSSNALPLHLYYTGDFINAKLLFMQGRGGEGTGQL